MRVVGTAGASAAAKPARGTPRPERSAGRARSLLRCSLRTRAGRPPDDKRGPGPWAGPRHLPQLSKSGRRIRERKSKQTKHQYPVARRRLKAARENRLKSLLNFAGAATYGG